ncbi:IMP cyclohydrolase [Paenibacillus psychroresistens]|uniref:IMP cyclohydrolase n=1 Tax=Paenibacillus psychroresistens TaxID=1778678 RepID=UPI002220057D|nr:IMP cyclohydrolase [Paenibacillus psychroresistens]
MGRSENSRNRVFQEEENHFVRNMAFDESKMTDPSLIIYYPIKSIDNFHLVTNGDQTETIMEGIAAGESFESSLFKREYEPDAPHYTPRISGIIHTSASKYSLSILKTAHNQSGGCHRFFYNYDNFLPGQGHCIHTYNNEVAGLLTPYLGEPFEVELMEDIVKIRDHYWNLLNQDNRISLLVKFIDTQSGKTEISILNKNQH